MTQQHKPSVVFLIGPPGSGKSTWRDHYLKSDPDAVIISTDDRVEAWGAARGLTYSQAFNHKDFKFGDVDNAAKADYIAAVNEGKTVIIDRTNMSKKSRAHFMRHVPATHHKRAVVFEVPRDELNARLEKRGKETGKYIPETVVDSMIKNFEMPTKEEFDTILKV